MAKTKSPIAICAVESCEEIAVRRGWCRKHYCRWLAHGDPLTCIQSQRAVCPEPIIEGAIAKIPLTRGLFAIVDIEDVSKVSGVLWSALKAPHRFYAVRTRHKNAPLYMHRVIMGDPKGIDIDHVDGDGLNNRRSNLREATRCRNMANMRKHRDNASGFKGVTWYSPTKKWQVRIMKERKQISLGYFKDPKDAARAYDKAALELFGEFAKTNEALGLL